MDLPKIGDWYDDARHPEAGELARFKVIAVSRTKVTLERTDGLQQSMSLPKLAKFYRAVEAVPAKEVSSG